MVVEGVNFPAAVSPLFPSLITNEYVELVDSGAPLSKYRRGSEHSYLISKSVDNGAGGGVARGKRSVLPALAAGGAGAPGDELHAAPVG